MLFDDWSGIGRVALVGVLAYAGLVALVRISGKRALSKMNAFDLVVTVALGSCLATVLLSKDTALAEGITAFALLLGLQWLVAFTSSRSRTALHVVKSTPALLVLRGKVLQDALHRERVAEEEVLAALRSQGIASLKDAAAVVLETDGSMTVLKDLPETGEGTLRTVRGPTPAAPRTS